MPFEVLANVGSWGSSGSTTFGVADQDAMLGYFPATLDTPEEQDRFIKLMGLILPGERVDRSNINNYLKFIFPFKSCFLNVGSETPLSGLNPNSSNEEKWVSIKETILFDFIHSFRFRLTGDFDKRAGDRKSYYRASEGTVTYFCEDDCSDLIVEYNNFLSFIKETISKPGYPGNVNAESKLLIKLAIDKRGNRLYRPSANHTKWLFEWLLVYLYDLILNEPEEKFHDVLARFFITLNFIQPFEVYYEETAVSLLQLLSLAHGDDLIDFEKTSRIECLSTKDEVMNLFNIGRVSMETYIGPKEYEPLKVTPKKVKRTKKESFLKFLSFRRSKSQPVSDREWEKAQTLPRVQNNYWGKFRAGKGKTVRLQKDDVFRYRTSTNTWLEKRPNSLIQDELIPPRNRKNSTSLPDVRSLEEALPCDGDSPYSDVFPFSGYSLGQPQENVPKIRLTTPDDESIDISDAIR